MNFVVFFQEIVESHFGVLLVLLVVFFLLVEFFDLFHLRLDVFLRGKSSSGDVAGRRHDEGEKMMRSFGVTDTEKSAFGSDDDFTDGGDHFETDVLVKLEAIHVGDGEDVVDGGVAL